MNIESPVEDNIDYVFNTSVVEENEEDKRKNQKDVEEKSDLNNDDEDWNMASAGNRRRRLKNDAVAGGPKCNYSETKSIENVKDESTITVFCSGTEPSPLPCFFSNFIFNDPL